MSEQGLPLTIFIPFLDALSHIISYLCSRMNRPNRRTGLAWMLLSIFVSMLLLSGVHHHEAMASMSADCMDCAHHVHHSGHFAASVDYPDDCLLCQFLHLVYTVAAATVLVPLVILLHDRRLFLNSTIIQKEPSALTTRGPPFVS